MTVREGMLRYLKWSPPKHWGCLLGELSLRNEAILILRKQNKVRKETNAIS